MMQRYTLTPLHRVESAYFLSVSSANNSTFEITYFHMKLTRTHGQQQQRPMQHQRQASVESDLGLASSALD